MAEITLRVPVGPEPSNLIQITNQFHTEYPADNFNDEIGADDEQAELFGRYAVGLYYTYYLRTFHDSLSENDVEVLNHYCDELNWYIRASRNAVRSFDSLWNRLQESHVEIPPELRSLLLRLFDSLGVITRRSDVRPRGSYDRESAFLEIRDDLGALERFAGEPDRQSDDLERRDENNSIGDLVDTEFLVDVNNILQGVQEGNFSEGRRIYRSLHKRFLGPLLERFNVINTIQKCAASNVPYEERYQMLFMTNNKYDSDSEYFESNRSALMNRTEHTFYLSTSQQAPSGQLYMQLTTENVAARISVLHSTIKRITFPSESKNIKDEYFTEDGRSKKKGPCVAILVPINPNTKQEESNGIVAFSGCKDGSLDIAHFFGYTDAKWQSHKNGIDLIKQQLCKEMGDSVARISDDVEYFNQVNGITIPLRDVRNAVDESKNKPCNHLPRMFSCCERKLLANILPKTVYRGGKYEQANLYIERKLCPICYDAIIEFEKSRSFKCELANPLSFVKLTHNDSELFDTFNSLAILIQQGHESNIPFYGACRKKKAPTK